MNRHEYNRSHEKLPFIGPGGQERLGHSRVLVIGAGGLGCPALEYIAGSGVGVIGIADADTVAVSNLHRQALYRYDDAGLSKAPAAAARLTARNPFIAVHPHQLLVDESNVLSLIDGYDIIMDCTDNFQSRYLINDACVALDKPLVYGAIHQGEGHLTVFNYRQSATLRCLFPESEGNDSIQSCADIGAYNITTGVIGVLMANEVIKIALELPAVLAGKLYYFDMLTLQSRTLAYKPEAGSREKSIARMANNTVSSIEISVDALRQKINDGEPVLLVDVREDDERQLFNIGGVHLPLQQFLREAASVLNPADTIIIYCERGGRSLQSVRHLREKGFAHAYSLRGGMQAWAKRSK